jgi:uncharacterized protein YqeY
MLHEKLKADSLQALRDKDSYKRARLGFFLSLLEEAAKIQRVEHLPDPEAITVLRKYSQTLITVEAQARNAGRDKDAAALIQEQDYLRPYLPETPSVETVYQLVDQAIATLHPTSMKEAGKVLDWVTAQNPQADRKVAGNYLKGRLQPRA